MPKLYLFMMVSLDGFFEGENHDLSWHNVDAEFNEFAIKQTREVTTILFGKRTYKMMAGYWTSEGAVNDDPIVAGLMNSKPKIVFSKRLEKVDWNNTQLVSDATPEYISELKKEAQGDIAIFGSNNLCVSLVKMGLVDEFRIMVNPIVIGKGTPLFFGLDDKLKLKLTNSKVFKSGNVLLYYQPV